MSKKDPSSVAGSSPSGYPDDVYEEFLTLYRVVSGYSIARYGDGEFNLVRGGNCISQRKAPHLQDELAAVLKGENSKLLVGIPRLDARSPKYRNWYKCCTQYGPYLSKIRQYYSSFITRPDSAPWIAEDRYYELMSELWRNKDITMVYGSERSLSKEFPALKTARKIDVVQCDYAHTYHRIDEIETATVLAGNKTVLLMCGPTATCLADRLSRRGFHAIDLGHIGMWWMAHRNPKLTSQLVYRDDPLHT